MQGGAQTKALHFIENLHVVKDNLFPVPPLFKLIHKESQTDYKEMYKVRLPPCSNGHGTCWAMSRAAMRGCASACVHVCACGRSLMYHVLSLTGCAAAGVQHGTPHGDLPPCRARPGRHRHQQGMCPLLSPLLPFCFCVLPCCRLPSLQPLSLSLSFLALPHTPLVFKRRTTPSQCCASWRLWQQRKGGRGNRTRISQHEDASG